MGYSLCHTRQVVRKNCDASNGDYNRILAVFLIVSAIIGTTIAAFYIKGIELMFFTVILIFTVMPIVSTVYYAFTDCTQYSKGDMKSRIQLQEIEDIGLVLYYDNPDYYHMEEDEQRLMLIRELNSYGFDLDENMLGIDKLKTFVHKKPMFSKNQNG